MSAAGDALALRSGASPLGLFERYLSVRVALGILTGVLLGNLAPQLFHLLAGWEVAHVNLVVAVLIWVMIYPMMIQVDFAAIRDVGKRPRGLLLTLVVSWLIKPFTMPRCFEGIGASAERAHRRW